MLRKAVCTAGAVAIAAAAFSIRAEVFKADPSRVGKDVVIGRVGKNFRTYTGAYRFDGGDVPATGLMALTDKGMVLVDALWNDEQTETMLCKLEAEFHRPVSLAVITHAHADKIGGINAMKKRGIRVISTPLTAEIAMQGGFGKPDPDITSNPRTYVIDGLTLEVFYPGAAHTKDNVVVYFPSEKLLYAGCVIKEMKARDPGNTADGDIPNYPSAVGKIIARYPDVKYVVITHGAWGGKELLYHTRDLLTHPPREGK